MFHMMNEARIAVGLGATMLGYAGYEASLDYAKDRPQGRPIGPGGKDATQPQIPIIRHADVKRMLLAQKSYCEGALALELYCARLVDELHTGAPDDAAPRPALLLEMLTPIAKSWPSEWCLEANSLAIQVHGGYGYTRDFPVEQYWRDNRLNMIHEGTHGIQALDLLGRKVVMDGGKGLQLLAARINATIERALRVARARRARQRAGRRRWQQRGRRHQGRLGHRQPGRGAGQRHALPAGLRPRGARPGSGSTWRCARRPELAERLRRRAAAGQAGRLPLLLPLRTAARGGLAAGGRARATTPAARWTRPGSDRARRPTIDELVWVLIYGGLMLRRPRPGRCDGSDGRPLGRVLAWLGGASLRVVGVRADLGALAHAQDRTDA